MKNKIIDAFIKLSTALCQGVKNPLLLEATNKSIDGNKWFDLQSIDYSLKALALWLDKNTLIDFSNRYSFAQNTKTIGVICAGNIPAVGFHDMLCVLLSGHKFLGKLSSDDKYLLPAIAKILIDNEPLLSERIEFAENKIVNFDAVIATGSNNSARYFEAYFGKYPHIIRHSRSSVAILDGKESDLSGLVSDMLTHKGLGCRNISKIYIPNGYDFSLLAKSFEKYFFLLDHNKYRNNYDYHKAIYIMNSIKFIDTGVTIMIENKELSSAISVINYEYYDDLNKIINDINTNKEKIQCVVSNISDIPSAITLGKTQEPTIYDFADDFDTMKFLNSL